MEHEDLNSVFRRRKSESKQNKNGSSVSSSTATTLPSTHIPQLHVPLKSPSDANLLEISMPSQPPLMQIVDGNDHDHDHANSNETIIACEEDSSSSRRGNPRLMRNTSNSKMGSASSSIHIMNASTSSLASLSIGGKKPQQYDARQVSLSGDLVQKDESRFRKILVRAISSVLMVIQTCGHCIVLLVLKL